MYSARKSFHQGNWSCNHFKEVPPTKWTLVLRKTGRVQWLAGKLHADIPVRVTLSWKPPKSCDSMNHRHRRLPSCTVEPQNHVTGKAQEKGGNGKWSASVWESFQRKKSSTQGPISGQNICLTVGASQSAVFIVGGTEEVSEGCDYWNRLFSL